MEVILPILEDERMGLDVFSLTFGGDVALLPDLGHPGDAALVILSESFLLCHNIPEYCNLSPF